MNFQSLDQIKREFNFVEDDPNEIQKKLRNILANLHPDTNGGSGFASAEDEAKFLKANEAYQFLQKILPEQTALVPVHAITELAKVFHDLAVVNRKEDQVASIESRLSEQVDVRIAQLGKQYLTPKVTLSAITAALSFVWLLPQTFSEHPILKYYVNPANLSFQITWGIGLTLTILGLYGTSVSEERQKRFQSQLKTETFQNSAFKEFLAHSDKYFSKGEFVDFLTGWNFHRNSRLPSGQPAFVGLLVQIIGMAPSVVEPESAQIIADIVFERAERRGVIYKDESIKQIEDVYSLSKSA